MLVSRCPECGKPAPVSLQHPERLQCLHCGYDGLPSAEARPYLQTALGVLQKLHVRHRQLTNLQKRALDSSWGALTGYLAFAIPVLVPFLCCGALGAVNEALAGLTYTGATDWSGDDALAIDRIHRGPLLV